MRVPKAYFCQIAGHISFILFSYFGEDLVSGLSILTIFSIRGRVQHHNVERSSKGELVCKMYELNPATHSYERKLQPFRIFPSGDGSEVLWGCKGRVWLDFESLCKNHVVWSNDRGKKWVWDRLYRGT
jgi:hypothetical protein